MANHSRLPKEEQVLADWMAEQSSDRSDGRSMKLGICVALYTVLALIWAPGVSFGERVFEPTRNKNPKTKKIVMKAPPEKPLEMVQVRDPDTRKKPMPDRTPDEPELVIERHLAAPPDVVKTDDWEFGIADAAPTPAASIFKCFRVGFEAPVIIKREMPEYPAQAVRIRLQGYVMLRAILRKDRSIDQIEVLRQIGKGKFGFEEKAIEALKKWEFLPGKINGRPVDIRMNLKIDFILNQ